MAGFVAVPRPTIPAMAPVYPDISLGRVQPTGSTAIANLRDHVAGWVNVKSYAGTAAVTGAHLTSAAAQATTDGTGILVAHPVTISTAVDLGAVPVRVEGGGRFIRSGSGTLTGTGPLTAPLGQIFEGWTAGLTFGWRVAEGYPEWWGAVPNDAARGATNLAAIHAAIAAVRVVRFRAADYYTSDTIIIGTRHVTLRGVSSRWQTGTEATRIIVQSATADVVYVGRPDFPAGGVNDFIAGVKLKHLSLTRSVAVRAPLSGSEIAAPAGVRLHFCQFAYLTEVYVAEHSIGFVLDGTVQSHFTRCNAFRSTVGDTSGGGRNDIFWGFFQNGNASIGLAGGNASTYYTDCGASTGGAPAIAESVGWVLSGPPVDTFMLRPETSATTNGIVIAGDGSQTGNADVHITDPVVDAFALHGLEITGVGAYGAIDVKGGYYAPVSGASTTYCMRILNSTGMIALTNNQGVCWGNTLSMGLVIESSSGVVARSNMYLGSLRPVALLSSSGCVIEDIINNPAQTATQAAVQTNNATRNRIAPVIRGGANRFPVGVHLTHASGTSDYNEVNCTGIDPASISGGSTNKLQIAGVAITTTGLSGNNLVAGVMN